MANIAQVSGWIQKLGPQTQCSNPTGSQENSLCSVVKEKPVHFLPPSDPSFSFSLSFSPFLFFYVFLLSRNLMEPPFILCAIMVRAGRRVDDRERTRTVGVSPKEKGLFHPIHPHLQIESKHFLSFLKYGKQLFCFTHKGILVFMEQFQKIQVKKSKIQPCSENIFHEDMSNLQHSSQ